MEPVFGEWDAPPLFELSTTCEEYSKTRPYPHFVDDNILPHDFALACQEEILGLPEDMWDRYDNPFESKYTLKDKNNLPYMCNKLFNYLTSASFVDHLSSIVGVKLVNDPTKNWWGIHKYDDGDFLDIHSDAGIHPLTKQKKHITLGIYLSKDWHTYNGGHLEIWDGESVVNNDAKLIKVYDRVLPSFNKLIVFTNSNNAWHGNPEPLYCKDGETRVFVTLSYLSENHEDCMSNTRMKAFFVSRPNDPEDLVKNELRLLRADPDKCKDVYRFTGHAKKK